MNNLKRIREERGLSQSKLAEASGVPLRTLQKYEIRELNINNAKAIYVYEMAEALKCEMKELLELEEKVKKKS